MPNRHLTSGEGTMASRYSSSIILILLSILMLLTGIGYVPSFPVVPAAHASPAGNPAILGMWNNTRKSNADFDTAVPAGKTFVIDVNVTGAPGLIQAVIGLNWTGSASPGLAVSRVSWDSTNGLTGGIFDCASRGCGDTALQTINGTTFISYQLPDNAQTPPRATVTGQIMSVQFRVLTTGSYTIHLNTCAKGTSCQSSGGPLGSDSHGGTGSILYASSPIAYQTIDGYFSNVASSDNFSVSSNQHVVAVLRTVSGTNLTLPIATISVALVAGPAHLTTLTVLGLPRGATSVQSAASCTPSPSPCTITLQIQVTGGLASA